MLAGVCSESRTPLENDGREGVHNSCTPPGKESRSFKMTSEPITFTRDEAAQMLCPVRDKPCVADACAAFRWTHMRDGKSKAPVGHCGLSQAGAE